MSSSNGHGNGHGINGSKKPGLDWRTLEAVLRHHGEFLELYRTTGQFELTLEGGYVVNLFDVLRGIDELPRRQRQAVKLMCLKNMREKDCARVMGLAKWTSPASSYKRDGLQRLVEKYWTDEGDEDAE